MKGAGDRRKLSRTRRMTARNDDVVLPFREVCAHCGHAASTLMRRLAVKSPMSHCL